MRRIVFSLVAVILVNLPWANDMWVQHQISSNGINVVATVVQDAQKQGENFLAYRLPKNVDPKQHLYGVKVSAQAFRDATANGHVSARVVPGSPNKNKVSGQVGSTLVLVIAGLGDAIIALLLGVGMMRRRLWTRFKVTAIDDDVFTIATGSTQLVVQLADDPDSRARIRPRVGGAVRGALYLVPSEDVVEGPPVGEITHLDGPMYRIAGRVRVVAPGHTEVMLANGYLMVVHGDDVEHSAELRGAVTATGTLMLASTKPR